MAALALACAGVEAAEIYRCTSKGRTSFRDKPCEQSEKQSVISQDNSRYVGCFRVDDSLAWEGGAGSWILRVEHGESGYRLKDFTSASSGKSEEANVPMLRADPGELAAVSAMLHFRATSGQVLQLPDTGPVPNGLFHIWDEDGRVRLVAVLPFVNGFAERTACR